MLISSVMKSIIVILCTGLVSLSWCSGLIAFLLVGDESVAVAAFFHPIYSPSSSSFLSYRKRRRFDTNVPSPLFYTQENGKDNKEEFHIPSGGISVTDAMEDAQKDKFITDLIPIPTSDDDSGGGVAQIVTQIESHKGSSLFEPHCYLVDISEEDDDNNKKEKQFVMIDVPPFSSELLDKMNRFMSLSPSSSLPSSPDLQEKQEQQDEQDKKNCKTNSNILVAILITNRDGIHYDGESAMYTIRKPDLRLWTQHFPNIHVVSYRLDTPRDCRPYVTQILDGYGPFAMPMPSTTSNNYTFIETGRPLTYDNPWDHQTAQDILKGKIPVPEHYEQEVLQKEKENNEDYSPEGIRKREEDKCVLAVYTPGYTFGSVSYVFPKKRICCSGFTIPLEDTREEEDYGTRPLLDCRGFITTSRGGVQKQMKSAKALIGSYMDRFDTLLPSRGNPLIMNSNQDSDSKKKDLLDIISDYEKIGSIYEDLGITSPNN